MRLCHLHGFVFPFREWKKNESYTLISVLLKSNNSTTLGCHRTSIKNANIFVGRILRNWWLIIIFNLVYARNMAFCRDDHRVETKGPSLWMSDFYHRLRPISLKYLSKTWTTRKPLIFQENKHSEETKAWYLDETLRAIASNSWSRMIFSRTVSLAKVRYAFSWTGMLLTRIPDLKTNPFATEFDRFYFEIYANRVEVSFSVGEIDVTKKKTRFSHARISDHKNFE